MKEPSPIKSLLRRLLRCFSVLVVVISVTWTGVSLFLVLKLHSLENSPTVVLSNLKREALLSFPKFTSLETIHQAADNVILRLSGRSGKSEGAKLARAAIILTLDSTYFLLVETVSDCKCGALAEAGYNITKSIINPENWEICEETVFTNLSAEKVGEYFEPFNLLEGGEKSD